MDQSPTNKASLYRKIAAVAGAIGRVEKDGYNPQLKYRYATPATIMEAVKPLLADQQLAIVPMVAEVVKELTGGKTQSGAEKVLTRVIMSYVILDGETGESLACAWVGVGEVWSDKGIAKAQTIALRTFLINLFQIPSGDDDPDADTQPQQRQTQRPASYEPPAKTPVKAAEKSVDAPQPTKRTRTRDELVAALRALWEEEKRLCKALDQPVSTPAAEVAISLDDPKEATVEAITARGHAARERVLALQAKLNQVSQEQQA